MAELPVRERIAAMAATCLDDGSFVNVGIGIPGLVPHHVPDERMVVFHAEHGVVGFGSDRFGPTDSPVLDFFGTTYRMRPGGFIGDHTRSFALVRSGRLDTTILGAFEVDAAGGMANFQTGGMIAGCPGGSPELAGAARQVIVAIEHCDKWGRPRLVHRTDLPVGPARSADVIVSELGWFVPRGDHFEVMHLGDDVDPDEVMERTAARVVFP